MMVIPSGETSLKAMGGYYFERSCSAHCPFRPNGIRSQREQPRVEKRRAWPKSMSSNAGQIEIVPIVVDNLCFDAAGTDFRLFFFAAKC